MSQTSETDTSKKVQTEKSSQVNDLPGLDFQPTLSVEIQHDVLGGHGGQNFRSMTRFDTIFALLTNQFGLGALGLPSAFRALGLIPGMITLLGIAGITYLSGLDLFEYYMHHPQVTNVVDMMKIAGGRPGEVLTGMGLLMQLIMTGASAAVTVSIALNAITEHAACTVAYIAVGCVVCFLLCIPRTAKFLSRTGLPCLISIVSASLVVMISLGVSNPPKAPEDWKPDIKLFGTTSFRSIFNAVLKIMYAFAGNYAFVTYMAEMKNPKRDFVYSLRWLIGASTVFYGTIGIAIYCLAAEFTTSPALGSAPIIAAKTAFGLVMPAILTTGIACGHIGTKYAYIAVMRRINALEEVTANTAKSWGVWLGISTCFWIVSFILSNAIPIFDSIVSISSATTYAWFTYGISGILWLHLHKGSYFDTRKNILMFVANVGFVVFSLFLNGAGLWSSVTELLDLFASDIGVRGSFSCGDNSVL